MDNQFNSPGYIPLGGKSNVPNPLTKSSGTTTPNQPAQPVTTSPVIQNPPTQPGMAQPYQPQQPRIATAAHPPVTGQTPVQPQMQPVQQGKNAAKSAGNPIKFLFIIVILCALGFGGVYAYSAMKTTYIPGISQYVEDYLYSPGDQVVARMNVLVDVAFVGAASELKDYGLPVTTDYTAQELAQYKATIGSKLNGFQTGYDLSFTLTNPSNVLGENSSGTVDQKFITELMSASSLTIFVKGSGSVDIADRHNVKNKGTFEAGLQLPGSKASLSLATLSRETMLYAKLTGFPDNEYINVSSILNKWISIDLKSSGAAALGTVETNGESVATVMKADAAKIKEVLSVDELKKHIQKAPAQTIGSVSAKCYKLDFTPETNVAIATAVIEKVDKKTITAEESAQMLKSLKEMNISSSVSFCYLPGSVVPNKIDIINDSKKSAANPYEHSEVLSFTLQQLEANTSFDAPASSETTPYQQVDYEKMIQPAFYELLKVPSPTPSTGGNAVDALRSKKLASVKIALESFYSEHGSYPGCSNGKISSVPYLPSDWSACSSAFPSATNAGSGFLINTGGNTGVKDYLQGTWLDSAVDAGTNDQYLRYYVNTSQFTIQKYAVCTTLTETTLQTTVHSDGVKVDCLCVGSGAEAVKCAGVSHR